MSKKRKRDPFVTVLIWTLILGILAAGGWFGARYLQERSDERLAEMQAEVKAANKAADEAYNKELAAFQARNATGANLAWPEPAGQGWEVLDLTAYPLEEPYTQPTYRQDALYNGMLLVNEWHSRPEDFSEESIAYVRNATNSEVPVSDRRPRLLPVASAALQSLVSTAKAEKLYDIYMCDEGYRSYDDQNALFQKATDKFKNSYSGDALIERAKKEVNYPGTSEFNTGLTFTIRLYKSGDGEVNKKNSNFFTSDEGSYFHENAWKYGLVFRFPLSDYPTQGTEDKSYKTGVSVKLRAYRYVGVGNAAVMRALDLCLEEYIEYLAEHPHIAVFEDGNLRYEIVRQYVGDADPFNVTLTGKGEVRNTVTSLDNMGFAVTVFEY